MKHERLLVPFVLCLAIGGCGLSQDQSSPSLVAADGTPEVSPFEDEPFEAPACASEPLPICSSVLGELLCPATLGYPFLAAAGFDERTSASIATPSVGTLCITGTLSASEGSWAQLILVLDQRGRLGTCVHAPFDARTLGITSFEFRLDQVPATRMILTASVIEKAECASASDCVTGGVYTLFTHDRADLVLLKPGLTRAAFEDFVGNDATGPMPASRLSVISMQLAGLGEPLDFDFCMSELRFLDAAEHQVMPPPNLQSE